MTNRTSRTFDVIVWGATGFTGSLVARYLAANYPANTGLRWAVAGRNSQKLRDLIREISETCTNSLDHVGVISASLDSSSSLDSMTSQAVVILATAGPFAQLGTPIVESCVRQGTNYVDITGETPWVREIIDKYDEQSRQKRLKIVPCCGFDCIPSDMGCFYMVSKLLLRKLQPSEVRFILDDTKGGISGGTAASILNIFSSYSYATLFRLLDPYYLNPKERNSGQLMKPSEFSTRSAAADNNIMGFDSVFKSWTIPYFMQAVDLRVVNRSNALGSWRYGESFVFSERMKTPSAIVALIGTVVTPMFMFLMLNPLTRWLCSLVVPKQGTGPSKEERESGYFKIKLWGKGVNTTTGRTETITGGIDALNGDPGYGQTARMVAEAAVCLALNEGHIESPDPRRASVYGVITPSLAFGDAMIRRMTNIGIKCFVNDN